MGSMKSDDEWPTLLDYATTRALFNERYPTLTLKLTDLTHEDGFDYVTYYTNDGPRFHTLGLDEDDQVVLRELRR